MQADTASGSALVVAITEYDHHEPLNYAAEEASSLAQMLPEEAYSQPCPEALRGGTSAELHQVLRSWLESVGEGNRLFLYWVGHGLLEGDAYYFAARDTPLQRIAHDQAVMPSFIAKLVTTTRPRKALLVFDACFSGAAVQEVIKTVTDIVDADVPGEWKGRGLAVFASAHPVEQVPEANLCNVLKKLLLEGDPNYRWSDQDRFIGSEVLFAAIEDGFELNGLEQTIYSGSCFNTTEMLANPRYRVELAAEDVETRRSHLTLTDGSVHFATASKGIEVGETGWYFTGRVRVLRELVHWLETAENGLLIVTGPPGAGKSAVMGRIATLSDPFYRELAARAGVLDSMVDGTDPPCGIIDVAIHAKGKNLSDCLNRLVSALYSNVDGLSSFLEVRAPTELDRRAEEVIASVRRAGRRITILLDGLDEAASGQADRIAGRLIVPLSELPNVRVLLGTRRSIDGATIPEVEDRDGRLRQIFGPRARILDLEDERSTEKDIADYVRLRLTDSKHSSDPEAIERMARGVAHKADGIFLYARVVSRTLQSLNRLDSELPTTALQAFVSDLKQRFGENEQRVDDLLAALAWGEGKGLTRKVWASIANALIETERDVYGADDVSWVLSSAGWHIIESGEDGQAVFRLAHQAFTDYYMGRSAIKNANDRIVSALSAGVFGAAWLDTDRYLWRHLSDHAVVADRLDELVMDLGYLAVANPIRLLSALDFVSSSDATAFADIYRRVVDRLIDVEPTDRMPLIHLTASEEDEELADMLKPAIPVKWTCRWARVRPTTPHRIVGRHYGAVTCVSLGEFKGWSIIASGGEDRTVRLWETLSGQALGAPLEGHRDRVSAVVLGELDGEVAAASGSDDGVIRLWNGRSGKPIGDPIEGHSARVTSVAIGSIEGRPIVVSGSVDRSLRLWYKAKGRSPSSWLRGGRIRHSTMDQDEGVTSVAVGEIGGQTVIASGGSDKAIWLWRPYNAVANDETATGDHWMCDFIRRDMILGHRDTVKSIALGSIGSRPVLVSGSADTTARLWNLRYRKPKGKPLVGHDAPITSVAFRNSFRRPLVATGSEDATIRLWNARTGNPIGDPLEGHNGAVTSVALGELAGRTVVVSGSEDGTVRLWNADSVRRTTIRTRLMRWIGNLRKSQGHVVSTGARSYDETGRTTFILTELDGRLVVIRSTRKGNIRVTDAINNKAVGAPLRNPPVDNILQLLGRRRKEQPYSLALGNIKGRNVLAVSGGGWWFRMWDLSSGALMSYLESPGWHHDLKTARAGSASYPRTGFARSLAIGTLDGRAVLATADSDGKVRLWDADTVVMMGDPLEVESVELVSVGMGEVDGAQFVISRGADGSVHTWNARNRDRWGAPRQPHGAHVASLAVARIDSRSLAVLGTSDGNVRLWDPLKQRYRVEINLGASIRSLSIAPDGFGIVVETARGYLMIDVHHSGQVH